MIQTVSIVGLGALGTMFSHFFSQQLPLGNVRIVADAKRIKRYQSEGVYCNDESFPLTYVSPDVEDFADLVIFAVKFNGLENAIRTARNQVGPQTVILSLLNGINSEKILSEQFGPEKVLYYTAPLEGTVLPGITRDSVLTILRDWGIKTHEEWFTIDQIMQAGHDGTPEEVFATGTAAVISPVGLLDYRGDKVTINNKEIGPLTEKLYKTLTGIQWGREPDPYGWVQNVQL